MIAEEIRRRREARGLTQAELAIALGVSSRTVSNWERGENVPKNRSGMLESFFGVRENDGGNILAPYSDAELLAELMRRTAERARHRSE